MDKLEEAKIAIRQKQTNLNRTFKQLFDVIEGAEVGIQNREKINKVKTFIKNNASHIDREDCDDYEEGYLDFAIAVMEEIGEPFKKSN